MPVAINHQQVLDRTAVFLSHSVNRDRYRDAQRAKFKIDIPQYPGSPLPLDSKFYVERLAIQTQAYRELRQPGSLIWIKAPQKMGKSSLLLRILHQAKQIDYHTVHLDFQQADQNILSNLDRLLRWMCKTISLQLQMECCLERYWDYELGCKVSFIIYLHHLLEQINQPLVLSLNEMNRLFEYPDVYREFLPLLRSLNEEARYDQVLQKLRLVLVSSIDTSISLNCEQLPFNMGLTLRLSEFSIEEVQRLALAYQLPWENSSLIEQLMDWVGGHPFLIQLAFYHLTTSTPSALTDKIFTYQVQQLLREATTLAGNYQNHLRHIWLALQADTSLLLTIEQLINSQEAIVVDSSIAYKLESLGIIKLEGDCATLRCRLYYNYFKKKNLNFLKSID
nr:AAA-like domain-containing protein [Gloeocapsopsis dulcis]